MEVTGQSFLGGVRARVIARGPDDEAPWWILGGRASLVGPGSR